MHLPPSAVPCSHYHIVGGSHPKFRGLMHAGHSLEKHSKVPGFRVSGCRVRVQG